PAAQVSRSVAVTVGLRALERHAESLPARDDRYLADRVCTRLGHAEHRVAGLVVRGALALVRRERDPALCAEHDLLERVAAVVLLNPVVVAASRREGGLVHEVAKVGADHAGRAG